MTRRGLFGVLAGALAASTMPAAVPAPAPRVIVPIGSPLALSLDEFTALYLAPAMKTWGDRTDAYLMSLYAEPFPAIDPQTYVDSTEDEGYWDE